jgi:hypothetical protein
MSYLALGRAHVAAGRWQQALATLAEGLSFLREYGTLLWAEPAILSQIAAAPRHPWPSPVTGLPQNA